MHRNDAWNALLELSRHARYFDVMTRRYRRYWAASRILLACSAVGVLTIIFDAVSLSLSARVSVAAIALVVAIVDLVLDFGKTAAVLDTIRKDLAVLEREGRDVWESGESFERMVAILRRMLEVSSRTDISTNDRLNQKCTELSYEVETNRYAA